MKKVITPTLGTRTERGKKKRAPSIPSERALGETKNNSGGEENQGAIQ